MTPPCRWKILSRNWISLLRKEKRGAPSPQSHSQTVLIYMQSILVSFRDPPLNAAVLFGRFEVMFALHTTDTALLRRRLGWDFWSPSIKDRNRIVLQTDRLDAGRSHTAPFVLERSKLEDVLHQSSLGKPQPVQLFFLVSFFFKVKDDVPLPGCVFALAG